jgi:hypothetical protein
LHWERSKTIEIKLLFLATLSNCWIPFDSFRCALTLQIIFIDFEWNWNWKWKDWNPRRVKIHGSPCFTVWKCFSSCPI